MLGELNKQEKIDRSKLQSYLPELKKYYPDLGLQDEHSKALQYEVHRLFSNLKTLSELKKNGKKVGRLRFKSKNRFKSFTYNQSGFDIVKTGNRLDKLHLSKIGDVPIRIHREIEGTIKQVTVKWCASGKWFASIMVEQDEVAQQPIKKMIGIDMNIENFLTDTDKRVFENPKYLKKSLKILKRRQSKKKKGSNNRKKHIIRVARAHERIENQRNDFMHKLSRKYVDTYDLIAIEDLDIKKMIESVENNEDMVKKHKKYFRRAIHDVSWNKFAQMLSYKAEGAGKTIERVDPFGTTKTSDKYKHYIASINILNKAIKKIGRGLSEFTLVDTEPILRFIPASSVVEARSYFQNL